jgi:cytochrome P450 family 110
MGTESGPSGHAVLNAMTFSAGTSIELPPGPGLPSRRVAQLWIEQPVEFWEECAARFGDTVTIELGSLGTTILFGNPEAVRQVFQLPPESYECRPFNGPYNALMGANSLFVSDGERHRRMRRMIMPPLHRRLVETHADSTRDHVRRAIAEWPAGRAFSPRPTMHLISLKIILDITFGAAHDELACEIFRVFSQEIYQDLGSWSAWTQFVRYQPRLRELIAERVKWNRTASAPPGNSLFDALVLARDEAGNLLGDDEIEDHIFTMLVAGVDPTALALSWALYWIHEDPDVLCRLRQEIDCLGPDADSGSITQLSYLTAVCLETLRMYPIPSTPTGRKLLAPAVIQGRHYADGVTLLPWPHIVHRREDLYPDPARFRPERFLERQYASHEYFPFGGGARTCVGASLAPLEMKLVLAEIVTQCDLVAAHEGPVRPLRHGTLLAPSDTMKFVLRSGRGKT